MLYGTSNYTPIALTTLEREEQRRRLRPCKLGSWKCWKTVLAHNRGLEGFPGAMTPPIWRFPSPRTQPYPLEPPETPHGVLFHPSSTPPKPIPKHPFPPICEPAGLRQTPPPTPMEGVRRGEGRAAPCAVVAPPRAARCVRGRGAACGRGRRGVAPRVRRPVRHAVLLRALRT